MRSQLMLMAVGLWLSMMGDPQKDYDEAMGEVDRAKQGSTKAKQAEAKPKQADGDDLQAQAEQALADYAKSLVTIGEKALSAERSKPDASETEMAHLRCFIFIARTRAQKLRELPPNDDCDRLRGVDTCFSRMGGNGKDVLRPSDCPMTPKAK